MDIFEHLNSALAQARALQAKLDAANVGKIQENLVALRTSLSETIEERDNARRSFQNLQKFNDMLRQQLESLQKECAAIHMCVTADSRTKLYDAMDRNVECGMEAPSLLKAVYAVMDRYFASKYEAERCASKIHAARQQLES